ncbi:MAG: FHA domain-containing protein [Dehalococcoidia bacterium]|nr:FHA domain-containing protein [Dehalococcoidia bacterium]MDD5493688.1 FHA domain-containing protein [Dehalococcoidia bacterium]
MKKLISPLLALTLALICTVALITPAYAQPSPPLTPEESWQPPPEGGEMVEPQVGVETYNQTWPGLQITPPPAILPGSSGSLVNAYLVNSYGQVVNSLYRNELCYLLVSFSGPGYFYLWEYYPGGASTYGHWLCYRWYRPYAGVWKIGPFSAQTTDPAGYYTWKLWYLSGYSWSTRTLSFNFTGGYYPPDIYGPIPQPNPPQINSFSSNMTSIESGQTAVLTWNTTYASTVTISPGVGTVATSGSTTVTPTATTVYTLTATGNTGNPVSSTVSITVIPRVPPTFSADQTTIQSGQSATLSWNAPAATSVTISGIGTFTASGTTQVAPDQTTAYMLTASYLDGTSQTTSVTVTVEQPPLLLYGLIALLAIAAILITVLLLRKPRAVPATQGNVTQAPVTTPAATTTAETTKPTSTYPATTPVEPAPAKLVMPDGSETILAGNARSFGRKDFEKFLMADKITYISRQHINIWYENTQYYIEDRSSTNGTKVNGVEIKGSGRQALEDGDVIDLAGKLNFTFRK